MTKLPAFIPPPTAIVREGIVVLGGLLLAAFILSRFPSLGAWVAGQSITLKDPQGRVLY
jgi:hypothetical protein